MDDSNILPIFDFPGYGADKDGNIYSFWGKGRANKTTSLQYLHRLRPGKHLNGYLFLNLKHLKTGTIKYISVHRAVCTAFYGKPSKKMTASHLNGVRNDNRADNLKWESMSENHRRKIIHGTDDRGVKNARAYLASNQVDEIKSLLSQGNLTNKELANIYKVSTATISRIKNNHRYN